MNIIKAGFLAGGLPVVLILAGCQTCREHPVACAIGSAVVVGTAIALADQHHHSAAPEQSTVRLWETK